MMRYATVRCLFLTRDSWFKLIIIGLVVRCRPTKTFNLMISVTVILSFIGSSMLNLLIWLCADLTSTRPPSLRFIANRTFNSYSFSIHTIFKTSVYMTVCFRLLLSNGGFIRINWSPLVHCFCLYSSLFCIKPEQFGIEADKCHLHAWPGCGLRNILQACYLALLIPHLEVLILIFPNSRILASVSVRSDSGKTTVLVR